MTTASLPSPTPGARMLYLIQRKATATREELIAHWFARHMPAVIDGMQAMASAGKPHAWRYIATLYDPPATGEHAWDGVASLWWDQILPTGGVAYGEPPTDSFQERAMPYSPWATREFVIIEGADAIRVEPSTLGTPFPCTRSGFVKISFLVQARPGVDHKAFHDHWLREHVPNVRSVLAKTGGLRYAVSLSIEPEKAPFSGLAEIWFSSDADWQQYRQTIRPDGMERYVDPQHTLVMRSTTEMIGIA